MNFNISKTVYSSLVKAVRVEHLQTLKNVILNKEIFLATMNEGSRYDVQD